MNILIAFLLFWAVLFTGSLNGAIALGNLDPSVHTVVPTTSVLAIEQGEPASGVLRLATTSSRSKAGARRWPDMAAITATAAPGRSERLPRRAPVHLTVRRAGRDLDADDLPAL